jgi:hypothetical protein
MDELWWFDRLARREIDPALRVVVSESQDLHPDYIVEEDLNSSPARHRCRLSIMNRHVNKPILRGSFVIMKGGGNAVHVEQSYLWHYQGTPIPVAPALSVAEMTQEKVISLARGFVTEFFRRLPETEE